MECMSCSFLVCYDGIDLDNMSMCWRRNISSTPRTKVRVYFTSTVRKPYYSELFLPLFYRADI